MSQVSSTRKLLSASALMASGTLVSRVLGMLRVVLIAFILGNGTRQADILGIATMVPNALYILFAGGALNTVLVPQIVRAIKNDEDGGEAYTNRIMTAFMLVVGVVAVVATVAAPLVTTIYSDSAWREPALAEQYASMVALTYLTLPQIFFYGAFFLLAQVLNARDKFGPMMWAPIANNVISIIVLSTYLLVWGNGGDKSAAFTTGQILLLGLGSTFGIVAQTLVLIPFLKKVGFRFRPRFDLKGTGLGHTFSLTKWTLGFVAVNQLTLVIVNRLATTATAGGVGAGVNVYSNAHLIWILPHSLITTSLATAMLPNASRLAAAGQSRGVAQEMTKTVRLALIFIVPAAVALFTLAQPMVDFLFSHGRGAADSQWVGWALMAFAVGLTPFTVQFVCLRTYYAMEDTRTPFFLQIGIAGLNAAGAILFVWWVNDPTLVATALAASYSAAYLVGVFVSWQLLRRRLPDLRGPEIGMHIVRLALGAAPGGAAAWFFARWVAGWSGGSVWGNLLSILVGAVLVLAPTATVGKLLKVRELARLSDLLRRQRGASPDDAREPEPVDDNDLPEVAAASPSASLAADEASAVTRVDGLEAILRPESAGAPETQHHELGLPEPLDLDDDPPTTIRPRPALPGDFAEDEADTQIVEHRAIGEAGMVLGVRYQLHQRLRSRPGSETWLAHDQVLARDVTAHIVASDDPGAAVLLTAARRGAAATDSRFLRVLDVDELHDGGPIGAYVVCEYAAGHTVEELLDRGPLTPQDGAFIVREVAEAMTPMHEQGLFHERIGPANILVTAGGGVRIIGFGVDAALTGTTSEHPWSRREADDVAALADVLRLSQEGGTPGDGLVDAWEGALNGRITTMSGLADALPADDGTGALEAKLDLADRSDQEDEDDEDTRPRRPVPADTIPHREHERPRIVLWVIVGIALAALVISLLITAFNRGESQRLDPVPAPTGSAATDPASPSGSPEAPGPLRVVDATDFDPAADGGNDEEVPDRVANVLDDDPETTWVTMRYLNRPDMGGLKPGVGIVLDLGEERTVTGVDITFIGDGPTSVELRAPVDEPSMTTVDAWDVVAANRAAAPGTTTIAPDDELTTRYVLVYLTELPPVDGGYRAEIATITVTGA